MTDLGYGHPEHVTLWGWTGAGDDGQYPLFWGWALQAGQADYPAFIHERLSFADWAGTPLVESVPLTHTQVHQKHENECYYIQRKVGTGDSIPTTAGQILVMGADGHTVWMSLADAIAAFGGP